MKILMVYPRTPETFWSFKHALKFISKKAALPPLGLLTVASLLPPSWDKKLIDMNIAELRDKDITWADFVFISAMDLQAISAREVIGRCRELGVKTVAGGPLFIAARDSFPEVDHLVLGEAENTLPLFLADLQQGTPGHIYFAPERPEITKTPLPAWHLIDINKYATLSVQ